MGGTSILISAKVAMALSFAPAAVGLLMSTVAIVSGVVLLRSSLHTHGGPRLAKNLAENISKYLEQLLDGEHKRCLGEQSELKRLRKRTEEALNRARTLRIRIGNRCSEERTAPEYLRLAKERTDRLIERMGSSLGRLQTHEARLEAFFQECQNRLRAAQRPLGDLDLVKELAALDDEERSIGSAVEAAILQSTIELQGRLVAFRTDFRAALIEAGIRTALEVLPSGSVERDFRILEDSIARFRPPAPAKVRGGETATLPAPHEPKQPAPSPRVGRSSDEETAKVPPERQPRIHFPGFD